MLTSTVLVKKSPLFGCIVCTLIIRKDLNRRGFANDAETPISGWVTRGTAGITDKLFGIQDRDVSADTLLSARNCPGFLPQTVNRICRTFKMSCTFSPSHLEIIRQLSTEHSHGEETLSWSPRTSANSQTSHGSRITPVGTKYLTPSRSVLVCSLRCFARPYMLKSYTSIYPSRRSLSKVMRGNWHKDTQTPMKSTVRQSP